MELNIFLLLFTICFVKISYCTLKEIEVIKYFPHGSQKETHVSYQPNNQYISTSGGYTYCLRVNFWTLYPCTLFETPSLSLGLENYLEGIGVVRDGQFSHPFEWKNFLELSYFSWNSFCISSHLTNLYFSINGKEVFNLTDVKEQQEKINVSTITLGSYFFTGQISDFNIWNRSLSHQEILKFSLSCESDFVEKSNPGILLWSLANFTSQGNSIAKATTNRKYLCQQNNDSKPKTKMLVFPKSSTSEFYSQDCKNLNGVTFYPQHDRDIQYLTDTVGSLLVNEECSGEFLVPFVRSRANENDWIYKNKENQDDEEYSNKPNRQLRLVTPLFLIATIT
jgi:hypothetical protein